RGERRAEVVARPRNELAPRVEELLEVRGHLVEGGAELEQLAWAGFRRARAQVAGGETSRRVAEPAERPQDLPSEQQCPRERTERRYTSDEPELPLLVHAEHDEPRPDHHDERQAHGGD